MNRVYSWLTTHVAIKTCGCVTQDNDTQEIGEAGHASQKTRHVTWDIYGKPDTTYMRHRTDTQTTEYTQDM